MNTQTAWKRAPGGRLSRWWGSSVPQRHPETWLAVLRIVTGLWFLRLGLSKLEWNPEHGIVLPQATSTWIDAMAARLAELAANSPLPWYRAFLESVVMPHPVLFANITALGESAIGLALALGLLTPVAATFGAMLALGYGLATFGEGPAAQGYHLLLFAVMIALAGSSSGRRFGLDALFERHRVAEWQRVEDESFEPDGQSLHAHHFIRPGHVRRVGNH